MQCCRHSTFKNLPLLKSTNEKLPLIWIIYVGIIDVSISISAISTLLIKTLIHSCASANVSKDRHQTNYRTLLFYLFPFFLYLLLNFIHPLPCPLTNRVMQHTRMFQGWQLWQPWMQCWAIKRFSWHSWVSHISLKWCENCESPAIIIILQGEKKWMKGRLVRNGRKILVGLEERNGERDSNKKWWGWEWKMDVEWKSASRCYGSVH